MEHPEIRRQRVNVTVLLEVPVATRSAQLRRAARFQPSAAQLQVN
jgi:hypothetical protein